MKISKSKICQTDRGLNSFKYGIYNKNSIFIINLTFILIGKFLAIKITNISHIFKEKINANCSWIMNHSNLRKIENLL